MHYIIFTGGTLEFSQIIKNRIKAADKIIAADSGAKHALALHVIPQIVIGDFDSLDQETRTTLQKQHCQFIQSPAEKDETDTELAIQYATKHGATSITILGGITGDRIDHILANIYLSVNISIPMQFLNGSTIMWVEKGPKNVKIQGATDDLLSLIPLTPEVSNIITKDLQYPLQSESLYFGKSRGISNLFEKNNPEVHFSEGYLLFIHIHKRN